MGEHFQAVVRLEAGQEDNPPYGDLLNALEPMEPLPGPSYIGHALKDMDRLIAAIERLTAAVEQHNETLGSIRSDVSSCETSLRDIKYGRN